MENTNPITKKRRGSPQNLRAPWKKGQSGNPKGRPKGFVRRWDAVMRTFFDLAQNNPEELEKITGLKLPSEIKGQDAQMILIQTEFIRALKGDGRAANQLMERMDGKADQNIKLESRSIVDLISGGQKAAEEAKAEAEGK